MRPKKVIVVVDGDELRLSVTCCVLDVAGFRVLPCAAGKQVRDLRGANVLVAYWPQKVERLASLARKCGCNVLLIGDYGEAARWIATRAKDLTPAELLDALKLLAARKRGPRKMPVGGVPVITDTAAVA